MTLVFQGREMRLGGSWGLPQVLVMVEARCPLGWAKDAQSLGVSVRAVSGRR